MLKYSVLDKIFNQPSSPRHVEYLAVDENLRIVDTSGGIKEFSDSPEQVKKGDDIRDSFPELIGYEDTLFAILQGEQETFSLKGIARSLGQESAPLYIDIYAIAEEEEKLPAAKLLIVLEDATERMVLEQTLVQRVNEANLLSCALSASRDYIDKIITSMADALLVTNRAGKIKRVNPAAIDLFGYSENELLEQHISLIIVDNNFLAVNQEYLLSASSQDMVRNTDVFCQSKTGKEIFVSFSCSAIHTDIEELQEFVYVGRDITDRKQAEEEMRLALQKEKELNELKTRFVSMVSHEFGNPLNTVLMSVEFLENYDQEIKEAEKKEYFQHIQSAVKQMSQLLRDVLLLGRAEAGKIDFAPIPLDLVKFCFNLVQEIRLSAGGKHVINFLHTGFAITEGKTPNLPLIDEKLLRHILTNLLANAVRYSPQGGTVDLSLDRSDKEIIFQIKDQGIGIPPEDLNKLFETFHRGKNVGKISGTGLGLAIVKQSVNIHGGKISVESEVGVGSTFTVTLPLLEFRENNME